MLPAVVALTFATSVLSGVFGMGGGMLLMAVLLSLMPVPEAMVLHGAVQLIANGSRTAILRRAIRWSIVTRYLVGAAVSTAVFAALAVRLDTGVAMLVLGALPMVYVVADRLPAPPIHRPAGAFACGVIANAAQLVAGVAGPLLDVFFLRSRLDRRQIVATKSLTQTIGHAIKVVYFGGVIGAAPGSPWMLGGVACAAIVGTRVGTRLLERLGEGRFRRWSRTLVMAIGGVLVLRGAATL